MEENLYTVSEVLQIPVPPPRHVSNSQRKKIMSSDFNSLFLLVSA